MANIKKLQEANAARWDAARITRGSEFRAVAKRLVRAKDRYVAVEEKTGVPWFVIAVIHQRESNQNFSRSLAQGDPWNKVSTHVPRGRGPFESWEAAAIDALVICPPYAAKWKDWSPGGAMTLLEQYNGLGYFRKGMPSPYVWSGTDQYTKGKYVADGVFNPNVVDKQLGCAGLIIAMMDIDKSISFSVKAQPKPIIKSKIAQGAGTIATVEAGDAIANANDVLDKVATTKDTVDRLGVGDQIMAVMSNPRVLVAIVVIAVCVGIIYWRWKDHGMGQ